MITLTVLIFVLSIMTFVLYKQNNGNSFGDVVVWFGCSILIILGLLSLLGIAISIVTTFP